MKVTMNYQPMTKKAIAFAMAAHEGQVRKGSGLPYIVHPMEVFSIVKKYKESRVIDDLMAAAALHDTVEDCGVTLVEIENEFSPLTASLVAELTNDPVQVRVLGKEAYMNAKLTSLSSWALVIKLADILANSTDQPNRKMVNRMAANVTHLKRNRQLSGTQMMMVAEIERVHREFNEMVEA